MANTKCPMCGSGMSVASNVKMGDIVFCDSCDAELEVVSLRPLELDWPLDDYDDDDYDDDDYDDYDDDYDD